MYNNKMYLIFLSYIEHGRKIRHAKTAIRMLSLIHLAFNIKIESEKRLQKVYSDRLLKEEFFVFKYEFIYYLLIEYCSWYDWVFIGILKEAEKNEGASVEVSTFKARKIIEDSDFSPLQVSLLEKACLAIFNMNNNEIIYTNLMENFFLEVFKTPIKKAEEDTVFFTLSNTSEVKTNSFCSCFYNLFSKIPFIKKEPPEPPKLEYSKDFYNTYRNIEVKEKFGLYAPRDVIYSFSKTGYAVFILNLAIDKVFSKKSNYTSRVFYEVINNLNPSLPIEEYDKVIETCRFNFYLENCYYPSSILLKHLYGKILIRKLDIKDRKLIYKAIQDLLEEKTLEKIPFDKYFLTEKDLENIKSFLKEITFTDNFGIYI